MNEWLDRVGGGAGCWSLIEPKSEGEGSTEQMTPLRLQLRWVGEGERRSLAFVTKLDIA